MVKRVTVRSFTEAAVVNDVFGAAPYAFVATSSGLDRWDLRDGQRLHYGTDTGLASGHVARLAGERGGAGVWLVTEAGIARLDVAAGKVAAVAPPPEEFAIGGLADAVLAPRAAGGAWVGLSQGLFSVSADGLWAATAVTSKVNALRVDNRGALYIATDDQVLFEKAGKFAELSRELGCDVRAARLLSPLAGGDMLIVGSAAGAATKSEQRIAFAQGGKCSTYRPSPSARWREVTTRGDDVLIMTARDLFVMNKPGPGKRRLTREGLRLSPVPRADGTMPARSKYVIRRVRRKLPAGARAMAAVGSEVLIGTAHLGTARIADRRRTGWLRRGELTASASRLTVACVGKDDCYVANGTPRLFRYQRDHFSEVAVPESSAVLAVGRSPSGSIVGVLEGVDQASLTFANIEGGTVTPIEQLAVELPGTGPQLSFARFSSDGQLWLGIAYTADDGEPQPYGVASVLLEAKMVAHHRASGDETLASQGVLPIPINSRDVAFCGSDSIWFASSQGAARVAGGKVKVYSEAEGLPSEYLRAIACSDKGVVYTASRAGIGVFAGGKWTYPRALARQVNDMSLAKDGKLWMATDRGLAMYDGRRVRRLDVRRGLLENRVAELVVDRFGRIWLRGAQGLMLVVP